MIGGPSLPGLLRQQTALARFGEFTLRSDDLTQILQEVTRLVAEGLHTEFAKILELLGDSRIDGGIRLVLRVRRPR